MTIKTDTVFVFKTFGFSAGMHFIWHSIVRYFSTGPKTVDDLIDAEVIISVPNPKKQVDPNFNQLDKEKYHGMQV